jgi:hypothetical protein
MTESSDSAEIDGNADFGTKIIGYYLAAFALAAVILEVISWINGGGVPSIISALLAIRRNILVIDIDASALRSPIIFIIALIVLGSCRLFKIDLEPRWMILLLMAIVVAAAFLLDGIYGRRMITQFMTSEGYSRCSSHDRHVGEGKGSVWFVDFVPSSRLSRSACT